MFLQHTSWGMELRSEQRWNVVICGNLHDPRGPYVARMNQTEKDKHLIISFTLSITFWIWSVLQSPANWRLGPSWSLTDRKPRLLGRSRSLGCAFEIHQGSRLQFPPLPSFFSILPGHNRVSKLALLACLTTDPETTMSADHGLTALKPRAEKTLPFSSCSSSRTLSYDRKLTNIGRMYESFS